MPTSAVAESTVTALGAAVLSQFDQYLAETSAAATAVAVEPSYSDIEYLARTAAWLNDSAFVFSAALPGSDLRLVVRLDELNGCAGNRDEAFRRDSYPGLILEVVTSAAEIGSADVWRFVENRQATIAELAQAFADLLGSLLEAGYEADYARFDAGALLSAWAAKVVAMLEERAEAIQRRLQPVR